MKRWHLFYCSLFLLQIQLLKYIALLLVAQVNDCCLIFKALWLALNKCRANVFNCGSLICRRQNLPKEVISKTMGDLCDSCISLEKNPYSSPRWSAWVPVVSEWTCLQDRSCKMQSCRMQESCSFLFAVSLTCIWQVKFRGITPANPLFLTHSCFPVTSMDLFVSFPMLSRLF